LKIRHAVPLHLLGCLLTLCSAGAEIPKIIKNSGGGQLIVHGNPYLVLGGEVGNSSSGTSAQADEILPRLAQMHINTVLIPVAWEQIEPVEGRFDFRILDHWIDTARQQNLHLALLWFGSWKNGFSSYAPAWVKQDTQRFPRAISADGLDTEILSTLGTETQRCDARAFSALMKHVKVKDSDQQTVLMVQVENEVGYLGRGRDRSADANRLFSSTVPSILTEMISSRRDSLSPELVSNFHPQGKTWREVFGEAADEVFMAWNYAKYIQSVAEAGKHEYPLPMFVNCQLPAPGERAGEYPSGGPHPYYLEVYRVTAPALDFFTPDIYWPDFEYWINRYRLPGNAVFVPEARLETAPFNALYAFGAAKAFGFSPFGVDSQRVATDDVATRPNLTETYAAVDALKDLLVRAQASEDSDGLVLHSNSPRATKTLAVGGYLMTATLSRSWPAATLLV
jgi:beta-galactosidase GanA